MFSNNLIQLRKTNNLSQEQLAEKLGVTRQAVSKWESGQAMPDVDKLIQLANMFEITTDQLLNKLESQPASETKPDLYTILAFIFLLVIWVGGLVWVICGHCFAHTYDGVFVDYGLKLMKYPVIIFAIMFFLHHIKRVIVQYRKK